MRLFYAVFVFFSFHLMAMDFDFDFIHQEEPLALIGGNWTNPFILNADFTRQYPPKIEQEVHNDWTRVIKKFRNPIKLIAENQDITDKIILELNPEWDELKKLLNKNARRQILLDAIQYSSKNGENISFVRKTLIALGIFLCEDLITEDYRKDPIIAKALDMAIRGNHVNLVSYILEKGANPNYRIQDYIIFDTTALYSATSNEVFQLLLNFKVQSPEDLLKHNNHILNPEISFSIFKGLIDNGANPQYHSSSYLYASSIIELIHSNSRECNLDTGKKLDVLLDSKIDPFSIDREGKNAFHHIDTFENKNLLLMFKESLVRQIKKEQHMFYNFLIFLSRMHPRIYGSKDMRYYLWKIFMEKNSFKMKMKKALNEKNVKGEIPFETSLWKKELFSDLNN